MGVGNLFHLIVIQANLDGADILENGIGIILALRLYNNLGVNPLGNFPCAFHYLIPGQILCTCDV